MCAFLLGSTSLLGSVVTAALIVIAHTGTEWLGGFGVTVTSLFVWSGLGAGGALAALAVTRSEPITEAQKTTEIAAILLAARARYRVESIGRHHITYIRDDRLVACCTPDGRILISSGIEETLPADQVRAIVEHERSHLRRNHARMIQLARLNAACFPFLACAREFERTIQLLSELAADDDAARACGPASVCNALGVLANRTGDHGMVLRAERLAAFPVTKHATKRRLANVSVIIR